MTDVSEIFRQWAEGERAVARAKYPQQAYVGLAFSPEVVAAVDDFLDDYSWWCQDGSTMPDTIRPAHEIIRIVLCAVGIDPLSIGTGGALQSHREALHDTRK